MVLNVLIKNKNPNLFYPLEVVTRSSDRQLQVNKKILTCAWHVYVESKYNANSAKLVPIIIIIHSKMVNTAVDLISTLIVK